MVSNKKYLCSFADSAMADASARFRLQGEAMSFYDNIYIYDESLLNSEFIAEFQNKFILRGYGYWSWKPQIILQTLEKMQYGDVLQYSDIGCHLNKEGLKRLEKYYEIAHQSKLGFLAFKMSGFPERVWTKGDVFDYFQVRNNLEIINTPQFWAGSFFIRKTVESEKIMNEWLNSIRYDFKLIDDSISVIPNFPDFKEHRHDQSLFSLLAKKYEFDFLEHGIENTKYFADYPILALRDKGNDRQWMKIMSYPQIYRGFIRENSIKNKVKVLLEVVIGQNLFLGIRFFLQSK